MMMKIRICNIAAYMILILLILAISPFVLPKVFSIEPYGILSNSMEPLYPVGSIVYVKKCLPEDINVDDVITFKQGVASESVATHRVIEKRKSDSVFITKGDNNEEIDAMPIAYERVIGKVMLCIPFLGHFYLWLVSTLGVAVCTFAACVVVILWGLVYNYKKRFKY